jgi:hypothetical protein
LSIRLKQLLRMRRAFESVGQVHERKRLSLVREKIETEIAIREISRALDSPNLKSLPLHRMALPRMAKAEARIAVLETEIAAVHRNILAARSRENHNRDLYSLLKAAEDRSATEKENLETVGAMTPSSPWQESDG